MAKLQPKDKVEWRAGATPSTSHMRRGVVKEILPEGIALVRTRVEGESRIEEIRLARLRKVEEPPKVTRKKKKKGKAAAKAKKAPARRRRRKKEKKAE